MKHFYSFLGVLFLLCSFSVRSQSEVPVLEVEYQALVDFYNAMDGKNWSNKWDISTNNINEGGWYGVSVEDGHIVGINLYNNNNIKGSIPKSFGNLKHLRSLELHDYYRYPNHDLSTTDLNNLSGLESLEVLNLSYCKLKDSIPDSWSKLSNLKSLYLNNNALSYCGTLGNNLVALNLNNNSLTSLPKGIGSLKDLETLNLHYNQIESIPISISSLTKLKTINLSHNKLKTVIKEFESLSSLTSLNLQHNEISEVLGLLPSKVSLNLEYQRLRLPEFLYTGQDVVIDSLPKVTRYNRSKNDFSIGSRFRVHVKGKRVATVSIDSLNRLTIPKQYFSSFNKEDDLYLYQEYIANAASHYTEIRFDTVRVETPPVPDIEYQALVDFYNAMNGKSWSNKWDISTNNINEGGWYGVSVEDGHIVGINLYNNNNIKGSIPKSFGNLKHLRSLELHDYYRYPNHDLSTTDLDNLSGLESLEVLNLSYCKLKDSIPDSWSKLSNLKSLYLNNNALSYCGTLGNNLVVLNLNNNSLTSLPKEIGSLKDLETLNLHYNQIESIPSSITSLVKLKTINLSHNKLKTVAKEFESLSSLTSLNLQYNEISEVLGLLPSKVSLNLTYQRLRLPEFSYTGQDAVIDRLPKVTRYNRSKNDFSIGSRFRIYVKGKRVATVSIDSLNRLTIPKQYFSNFKKEDDFYLYQDYIANAASHYTEIRFDTVRVETPPIPNIEYQALVDFYNAMDGKNWKNKWDVSTNNINEGGWYGVSVEDGHIVGINLYDNNIKGAIPESFSDLKYLRSLQLHDYSYRAIHDLSTTDLDNLSGLESLEVLNLSYCKLKDSIPDSWSKLSKLKSLYLNNNSLTSLPKEIGSLKDLETLNLHYNQIESIPISISSLTKLKTINLSHNKLKTVIKEFEDLSSLTSLNLQYNEISEVLGLLPSKVSLNLTYQRLRLPEFLYTGQDVVIDSLPKVTRYNRSKNDFSIASRFRVHVKGKHVTTVSIDSLNRLTIPKQYFSNFKKEDDIYLYQDYIANTASHYTEIRFDTVRVETPPIPNIEYQALVDFYNAMDGKNWKNKWDVSTNNINEGGWYGVSVEDGHIVGINLYDNNIKGAIPESFSDLKYLRSLQLHDYSYRAIHDLSTTDLDNLSGLESLEVLNLSYCKLKDSIPDSWSKLSKLKSLYLNDNSVKNIATSFSDLKLKNLNFERQIITSDSIEVGANQIEIKLPLHLVVQIQNDTVKFDAKNEFKLYVNGSHQKTAFSNNGRLLFEGINLLKLKETDKIRIEQINGLARYTNLYYNKVFFGPPLVDEEFEVLKKVYNSTGGDEWINKWDITANNLNKTGWFGVSIKDGHVIELNLTNNNLSGTIPEDITKLKHLRKLNLSNNSLSGILPNNVHLFSDLEEFNVNSNALSGKISTRVAELLKLRKFAIANNKFAGTIPTVFSDFKVLNHLDISSNSFDKIEKKIYYDYSKTYIDLRNQKIKYDTILSVNGKELKVDLEDIVRYDLKKNNYEAKNSFSLLVNDVLHDETILNDKGEVLFTNVRISEIPKDAKIVVRQTTGSFVNTEFTFSGIEDKSRVPVKQEEYTALVKLNASLNGAGWTHKWDTITNNLHDTKWHGVTTYDGHIVGIDISNNNISGIIPDVLDSFPNLLSLNVSSNNIQGIEKALPKGLKLSIDRQNIDQGEIELNRSTSINDYSINRYDHKQGKFINQTYTLKIGDFYRTVTIPEVGINLMDLKKKWKVPNNQSIELRQTSGNAINSLLLGKLTFEEGDANIDGTVNILDIQTTINSIVGNPINYFNYYGADMNKDDQISILDIIAQVGAIQSQKPRATYQKMNLANRARNTSFSEESKVKVSIDEGVLYLDTQEEVTSFEIRINNVSSEGILEKISDKGFTTYFKEEEGEVNMIAFSFNSSLKGRVALASIKEKKAIINTVLVSDKSAEEIPHEIIRFQSTNPITEEVLLQNYPNPFKEVTTIEFFANENQSKVKIDLYNIEGKKITTRIIESIIKGKNTYVFKRKELPSGVYFYAINLINDSTKSVRGKMIID